MNGFINNVCSAEGDSIWDEARAQLLNGTQLSNMLCYNRKEREAYVDQDRFRERGWPSEYVSQLIPIANEVARLYQPYQCELYASQGFVSQGAPPALEFKLGGNALQFSYLGYGHYGIALKVDCKGCDSLVLKIYFPISSDHKFFSGPFSETALGIYVSANNVSNMPHLLAALPSRSWILTEFIDFENRAQTKSGPTFQDLGIVVLDDANSKHNHINTRSGTCFRVDYGHLTSRQREPLEKYPKDLGCLMQQYACTGRHLSSQDYLGIIQDHKHLRSYFFQKLNLVNPPERLEAIAHCFNFSEFKYFPIHDYFTAKVLDLRFRPDVFDLLMSCEWPLMRAKAVFNCGGLDATHRFRLRQAWKSLPEFAHFRSYLGCEKSRRVAFEY